jgi:hypothetical protein
VVDGLHTLIQNRTMKPLAVALSGGREDVERKRWWGDLTNV